MVLYVHRKELRATLVIFSTFMISSEYVTDKVPEMYFEPSLQSQAHPIVRDSFGGAKTGLESSEYFPCAVGPSRKQLVDGHGDLKLGRCDGVV